MKIRMIRIPYLNFRFSMIKNKSDYFHWMSKEN